MERYGTEARCHAALELMRHLGVRGKAAWLMKHKLLQVMAEREERRVPDARAEVGDACLGGERPGRRGRGSENKVSFSVAVQTSDDGRPRLARMNQIAFTEDAVADYRPVVVGSGGQAVVTHPEFSRVNTVLSTLKTASSGTCHHFSFAKHVDRYLAEVPYRFNRRFDLKSILIRLVRAAVLARPRPEPRIRLAGVEG